MLAGPMATDSLSSKLPSKHRFPWNLGRFDVTVTSKDEWRGTDGNERCADFSGRPRGPSTDTAGLHLVLPAVRRGSCGKSLSRRPGPRRPRALSPASSFSGRGWPRGAGSSESPILGRVGTEPHARKLTDRSSHRGRPRPSGRSTRREPASTEHHIKKRRKVANGLRSRSWWILGGKET